MPEIELTEIKWVPEVYPRKKWRTETINRYADAMEAGDKFPPLILEVETNILLDGKHRLEAYKKVDGIQSVVVEYVAVPEGMSKKYFAATLSSRHGDRLSNADIENLALEEFALENGQPMPDPQEWGKKLGVSKTTVYRWVSHLLNKARADRQAKAWRLSQLGWTNQEIADVLGANSEGTIREDRKNSHLGKIANDLGPDWNDKGVAEWANRVGVSLTDAMAAAMIGMDDVQRLKQLGIKIQPYDVWNFNSCHNLMGDVHPGRIPGELVCHALYYWTSPNDLVVDPMAGSGTILDACLLMGRKGRGYDIDERHDRIDIEKHDLSDRWPKAAGRAKLIFWDPPYFDKKDTGYIDGSISEMEPGMYIDWISERFQELYGMVEPGAILAFLMSDWDPENAKNHNNCEGIFLWDYAKRIIGAGWKIERQVQCPLPTQQVHPDIVNKFRESRRMARLSRYLLKCVKA